MKITITIFCMKYFFQHVNVSTCNIIIIIVRIVIVIIVIIIVVLNFFYCTK